jgi:hypothetical protein
MCIPKGTTHDHVAHWLIGDACAAKDTTMTAAGAAAVAGTCREPWGV